MSAESILLSIVVPTKNRTTFLKSFIELVYSFKNEDIELVIQDNSDNNEDILAFLKDPKYYDIIYNYDNRSMPVITNSELAIMHARGKYVCFMGDDDLLSGKLYDFVKWMDKHGYESAVFNHASYSWPGVTHKAHKFPSLRIPTFKGNVKELCVDKEFKRLLRTGAVALGNMPQLYQAVVLRTRLDDVYQKTGTYFPGPSPDMAISAALGKVVTKHVFCDLPLVSSGASPKSAAGMGAKHKHKGNLKDISFLPNDTAEVWEKKLPKIWTGPTIYAESCLKALRAMGADADVAKFNYSYFYAYFYVFCKEYAELLKPFLKDFTVYSPLKYLISSVGIFACRCYRFLKNILISHFGMFGTYKDDVPTSFDAQMQIDDVMASVIQHH